MFEHKPFLNHLMTDVSNEEVAPVEEGQTRISETKQHSSTNRADSGLKFRWIQTTQVPG